MSLKTRINKIASRVHANDEIVICVMIVDKDGSVTSCNKRQPGCQPFPCRRDGCQWRGSDTGVLVINVRSDHDVLSGL